MNETAHAGRAPDPGLTETVGRRTFLKVLGSAAPAAAAAACSPVPPERIIPYVVPPEDVVPGVATWYASVCGECPTGCGALVKTREGRAIKVEGNPAHPVNRGALCIRGQAALQGLYSPDRFPGPRRRRVTSAAAGQSVFEPVAWDAALTEVADRIRALRDAGRGDRIALVTPLLTGALDRLADRWAAAVGGARRLRYEAFAHEAVRRAHGLVFDRATIPDYDVARAELIVSFGADFLDTWISPVSHARGFADARRPGRGDRPRAQYVHLEPRLSLTASSADEWIATTPGADGAVAAAMVQVITAEGRVQADGVTAADLDRIRALVADWTPERAAAQSGVPAARIFRLARAFSDPAAGPGRTLAVGGGVAGAGANAVPAETAVALLNYVAGNVGATVRFLPESPWEGAAAYRDLLDLAEALRAGAIELLILHDVNPVHTAPAAADLAGAIEAAPFVVAASSHPDETTARADLILPTHTPLEAWGDHRAAGRAGLMQPTMRPIHDTRHVGDVLLETGRAAAAAPADTETGAEDGLPDGDFYDLLREAWREIHAARAPAEAATPDAPAPDGGPPTANTAGGGAQSNAVAAAQPAAGAQPETGGGDRPTTPAGAPGPGAPAAAPDFETFWADALRQGGSWRTTAPAPIGLSPGIADLRLDALDGPAEARGAAAGGERALTLLAYPSPHFYDGRGANRPWLQEIPDPVLKTAWGSWVELTPATAAAVGAEDGQLVTLASDHGRIDLTVVVNPHLRDGVAAVPIGQGHTDFGRYATGRGASPIALLDPAPDPAAGGVRWAGVRIDAIARDLHRPVARLQRTFDQDGRELARAVSAAALAAGAVQPEAPHPTLNPPHDHPEHRWGMAIDLNACTGCNACVAACYAENNVPVLGADRLVRGRTMAWLRIERFVEPPSAAAGRTHPETRFLPMLCQHCDHAPCETVCPVFATYHTDEGLNAQVYNRCVGTRYCSNNCPYKVRRFNWWTPEFPEPLHLQLNPDVTARSAGVMEKCTFCVQRIQAGKDRARDEARPVRDGDVTPACAQTCPAQAIVFGDLGDPDSRVSQLAAEARGYHVLGALNTRPAITYLQKVTG